MGSTNPIEFKTKVIDFKGRKARIVCQNLNGPCPLLAIINALTLQNKLNLPDSPEMSSSRLQELLVGHIVDSSEQATGPNDRALNLQHQVAEVIDLVMRGRFVSGLDMNPKFQAVSSFEYTQELAVFDLCGVNLYHGWIVDPSEGPEMESIANLSYNQATLALISEMERDPSFHLELRPSGALRSDSLPASILAQLRERSLSSSVEEDLVADSSGIVDSQREVVRKLVSDAVSRVRYLHEGSAPERSSSADSEAGRGLPSADQGGHECTSANPEQSQPMYRLTLSRWYATFVVVVRQLTTAAAG